MFIFVKVIAVKIMRNGHKPGQYGKDSSIQIILKWADDFAEFECKRQNQNKTNTGIGRLLVLFFPCGILLWYMQNKTWGFGWGNYVQIIQNNGPIYKKKKE